MKQLIYALLCSSVLLACSKNGNQSKAALLTAGNWKVIADTINPARNINGHNETDMYQFYDPICERDDYFKFTSDGTYELNNGSQKCQSSDPQTISGTWFFSDGDTKLNLAPYNNYLFGKCDIQELTASRITLVWYTRDQNGSINRTHVITLTH